MTDALILADLPEADWLALRDALVDAGWAMEKGGGLDHAWAILRQGELRIDMQWDRWEQGEVHGARGQVERIAAALPDPLRPMLNLIQVGQV